MVHVLVGSNWHVLVPGKVFRCAQMTQAELEQAITRHGIRTVLNLRGCCYPLPWYVDECRATHHCNIAQEDFTFSANRYPSKTELRRLLEVLDSADYPVVLHCRRGADRTGMAAALVLLLQEGVSYADARSQLGPRFGHLPVTRTVDLDEFFTFYEAWLGDQGKVHSPAALRRWIEEGYCEGHWHCDFPEAPPPVLVARRGEPWALSLCVRNRGTVPWTLSPSRNAGIHLGFMVFDGEGQQVAAGRGAVLEGEVRPGQSVPVTATVPAIPKAGTYRMVIDMVDERHGWFYQMGAEPLEREVQVRE